MLHRRIHLLLTVKFMRHHITNLDTTDVNQHRNTYRQSNITYDLLKPCYIIYCLTEIQQA